ncbi:MAG: hypothetical protein KDC38_04435 [Planctomycetes bacterium]|nr:hypothetical protein [Planctomycetota bacterium]
MSTEPNPTGPSPLPWAELRDREDRRIRRWTGITIGSWTLTAGYLIALAWGYLVYVHPALHVAALGEETSAERLTMSLHIVAIGLQAFLVWPFLLLVSAISTSGLVLLGRTATLAQVRRSLAALSEQLDATSGSA